MRVFLSGVAALVTVSVSNAAGAANSSGNATRLAELQAEVAAYAQLVEELEAQNAIENLQAAWGYYIEHRQYDRAAALFSEDASFEYGQRGVYRGRERAKDAMRLVFGEAGPHRLNINMQLQPFVTVAPDKQTAQARWRSVQQIETEDGTGRWGAGVYENTYRKVDGKWTISSIHYFVTFLTDYDQGWQNGTQIPMQGPSRDFPPDAPPTQVYRSLPGAYLPPYHYVNPVSGKDVSWPD